MASCEPMSESAEGERLPFSSQLMRILVGERVGHRKLGLKAESLQGRKDLLRTQGRQETHQRPVSK